MDGQSGLCNGTSRSAQLTMMPKFLNLKLYEALMLLKNPFVVASGHSWQSAVASGLMMREPAYQIANVRLEQFDGCLSGLTIFA